MSNQELKECVLCNIDKDKNEFINMTCDARHEFCFGCIIKNIEINKTNKECPLCRTKISSIIIPPKSKLENFNKTDFYKEEDFYSIYFFNKCIPFLNILGNTNITNVCLIENLELTNYTKNKNELIFAVNVLKSGAETDIDKLYDHINWKTDFNWSYVNTMNPNDLSSMMFTLPFLAGMGIDVPRPSTTQAQATQTNTSQTQTNTSQTQQHAQTTNQTNNRLSSGAEAFLSLFNYTFPPNNGSSGSSGSSNRPRQF